MTRSKTQMLAEFIEGLNLATAASGQLVHHFSNPKWMAVRDMLELVRDNSINMTLGVRG